jgi:hypothetical protein
VKEAGYPDLGFDGLVGFFGSPAIPNQLRDSIAADVRETGADPGDRAAIVHHRADLQPWWAC